VTNLRGNPGYPSLLKQIGLPQPPEPPSAAFDSARPFSAAPHSPAQN
jgi:hypothetical protein